MSIECELTLSELRSQLRLRQITLTVDGAKLVAVDPHGRLSPTLDAAIRAHRDELANELRSASDAFCRLRRIIASVEAGTTSEKPVAEIKEALDQGEIGQAECDVLMQEMTEGCGGLFEDTRMSDFATSGQVREVYSKTLGETVVWAADNAVVPDTEERVVYRARELRRLVDATPEQLRRIHLTKTMIDGEVVEPDAGGIQIPASALYDRASEGEACHACRQSKWRIEDTGQRVCEVCHPSAKKQCRAGRKEQGRKLIHLLNSHFRISQTLTGSQAASKHGSRRA